MIAGLYETAPDNTFMTTWNNPSKAVECFPVTQLNAANDYMLEAGKTEHCYFTWGLFGSPPEQGKRGRADQVVACPGILFDADLFSNTPGVHSKTDLPRTVDEVTAWLAQAGFPDPTCIISSGNGLYLYYLHPNMAVFEDEKARRAYQKFTARFHKALRESAKRLRGWSFDTTQDISRATRMPGSLNHKTTPPKPVEVISETAVSDGPRYSIEALEQIARQILGQEDELIQSQSQNSPNDYSESDVTADFEAILMGCRWVRARYNDPESQSYDDWLAMATILTRCKNGHEIFREMSAKDSARYSVSDTQEKFSEVLKKMKPWRCQTIADTSGYSECDGCPIRLGGRSPMTFGFGSVALARLRASNVFDAKSLEFVDVNNDFRRSEKSFNCSYNAELRKADRKSKNASGELTLNRNDGVVDSTYYSPGDERRVIQRGGLKLYNAYRPGPIQPQDVDCQRVLGHFSLLVPEESERHHLFSYLACMVQRPSTKLNSMVLITGGQGIGKSTIGTILSGILGDGNTKNLSPDMAENRFRSNWGDCQLLILEELMMRGRLEFYNELKPWITEEEVLADRKGKDPRHVRTPRGFLAFSNFKNAAMLPSDDRRVFVVGSSMQKQSNEYYQELYGSLDSELPGFLYFLLRYDLSGFNPKAPPPVTAAKKHMIERAMPPVNAELSEAIENAEGAFKKDLITLEQIQDYLQVALRMNPRRGAIEAAKESLGIVSLPGQVENPRTGQRRRYWIIRNHEKWREAGQAEAKNHLFS